MKKTLAMLLVLVMSLCFFAGCGATETPAAETPAAEAPEAPCVGVAMSALDSQYRVVCLEEIQKVVEAAGGTCEVLVAEDDAVTQNSQIESLLAMGVDAVVCYPVDGEAVKQAVAKCNEVNVPFIYADRPVSDGEDAVVSYGVATDNYVLAMTGTQWIVDKARAEGIELNCLVLVGALTDNNAIERDKGFMEVLEKEENADVVKSIVSVPSDWNLETTLSGTVNALTANPNINCIICPSDFILPGVQSALQQKGMYYTIGEEGHVMIASFDGDEVGMQAIIDGYSEVNMAQDIGKTGRLCAEAALKLISGETLDVQHELNPGFLVTIDDYETTGPNAYGWPQS